MGLRFTFPRQVRDALARSAQDKKSSCGKSAEPYSLLRRVSPTISSHSFALPFLSDVLSL